MDHFALIVKDISCDENFALTVVMLLQNTVEASDGVACKMIHGSAHVQDKNQFRKTFFHSRYLL